MKILVLNGPNLNLLGEREPDVYGSDTLGNLEEDLTRAFPEVSFEFFQSNSEGDLLNRLHKAHFERTDGIVFNPAGYSHTSVALRDAVSAIQPPVVEVHISNIHGRERFRRHSYLAAACVGQISGLGFQGYHLAVRYLIHKSG